MSTFPFEELPLELQEQILEQPGIARTSVRMRPFYEASQNVLCRQPPSRVEMAQYLDGSPSLLGVFWLNKNQAYIYHRLVEVYLQEPFYLDLRTCQIFPDNDDIFGKWAIKYGEIYMPQAEPNQSFMDAKGVHLDSDSFWDREELIPEIQKFFTPQQPSPGQSSQNRPPGKAYTELPTILKEPQLDLLSTYRILSQRQVCTTRQPDYAKVEVLRRLSSVEKAYAQNPNIISMLASHSWLAFQCRILNVYPPPPIHFIVNWIFTRNGEPIYVPLVTYNPEEVEIVKQAMRAELEAMSQEIPIMAAQIRRAIEQFD